MSYNDPVLSRPRDLISGWPWSSFSGPMSLLRALLCVFVMGTWPTAPVLAAPELATYLARTDPASLVPGADSFGPLRDDLAVAPLLGGGRTLGWVFLNADIVAANGYSGRPIRVLVALDPQGVILAARLLDQSEPLLQGGRRRNDVTRMVEGLAGRDLTAEAEPGGSGVPSLHVSGVTTSVRVIEDSVIRSGLKVAFHLELGGLVRPAPPAGTTATINAHATAPAEWNALLAKGLVGRFEIGNAQINAAFAAPGNPPKAANHPVQGEPTDYFIDLYTAQISVPGLAAVLLRDIDRDDLQAWLEPGDSAILVAARGSYPLRDPRLAQSGVWGRLALVQGTTSYRFSTRDQFPAIRRLAAQGAPALDQIEIFRLPAHTGFDPTAPWRLSLLVERRMGAIERAYQTFDIAYALPADFVIAPSVTPQMLAASAQELERAETAARRQANWRDKAPSLAALSAMLAVLTGAYFFQMQLVRSARRLFWFRTAFLVTTLVFLGWHANAQLSVVNLLTLLTTLGSGQFDWENFLVEPMTFVLWFAVAAALIFWGRGAYCGWLCPFGALQELSNQIARRLGVPQLHLPWGMHERLWAVKYIILLGLIGATLASYDTAVRLAEVEPFRTTFALRFARSWPFLLYLAVLLGLGLFIERFYCRYLCPLGAALAIPARLRMFDWLRRYRDCGNPCHRCADNCFVQAITPLGEISANECLGCLHCQMMFQSNTLCPVVIRRERQRQANAALGNPLDIVRQNREPQP